MLDVQSAYWTLVLRIEELKIARQSLQRAEILMRNNEVRVRAGAMAPIELKVAQAEVATQQESVIVAENKVRIAEREMKRLMNVEKLSIMADTALVPTNYPRFDRKVIDEAYCIESALQKRPDFLQTKTDLETLKIDIKFTRNGLYPQVDFIGSINFNGLQSTLTRDNDMIFDGNMYDALLGVQLTVPLNGNRVAKAKHAAAQLRAARSLRELKRLELQIVTEVRNTVSTVETNSKRVDTTRVARELRQERLDAAEKQLEVGRITSFEVVTAQEDLAKAQGAEILAIIDYVVSLATLSRQMATILDELGLEVEESPILR
jgi:outer membrane protein TolC